MRSSCAIALTLLVGGCANLASVNPFRPPDVALDTAAALIAPDKTPDQRRELIEQVESRYDADPSDENLLALAVVYAVPGQAQSSTKRALELLDKLDTAKLSRRSRQLADWLGSDVAYRDSLERSNRQLGDQLAAMKEALARAREKIEILTRIEQTIGPAPQLRQNPGEPQQ